MSEEIVITKHAEQRARERLGLKRSAVPRTVEKAWHNGVPLSPRGHGHFDPAVEYRVHMGFRFVFKREGSLKLLTVTPLSRKQVEKDGDREARERRVRGMGRRWSWRA